MADLILCDTCDDQGASPDDVAEDRCPKSRRTCGHHCNHRWTHDKCCWCGLIWVEEGVTQQGPVVEHA